jgi:phage-related baseplate assembly protein
MSVVDKPSLRWDGHLQQLVLKEVWVAVAVYTKAVQVSTRPATEPIGGRQAIFSRPQTQLTQVNAAEIIAVRATHQEASDAVAKHRAVNPDLGAEYKIEQHPVGEPADEPAQQPAPNLCIGGCGRTAPNSQSYCQPCRETLWKQSGWVPDGKDEQ